MGQEYEFARLDPAKVVTAEACGECHVSEAEVWKKTPHAEGFKTLHRKENAASIAKRMGFDLIKRDSICLSCHYTTNLKGSQLRAVSGVSCESCHGAGRDYLDIHNDYGKGFDHKTEPAQHREERIEKSRAAGMRRPSELYDVVTGCFSCHTVPQESLVNQGRHSIGSSGFEFVEWSQGVIRHNFLDSFLNGDGTVNAERSAEAKRRMYVVGRAVDYEYSLRGVASATEEGVFLKAMQRRLRSATNELRAIRARADLPEVETMLASMGGARASLGQQETLLKAAEAVGRATRQFIQSHDGGALASLDPLVEGTAEAEDFEEPDLASEEGGLEDPSAPGTVVASDPSAPGTSATTAAQPTGGSSTPARGTAAIPAVGQVKTRLRPTSKFATVSAGECQRCHGDQNAWWFNDAHYTAADPFFDRDPRNVQIARLYGISPSKMSRGDHLCMDCHGTVVTGKERREVEDGVSCQSCHGPAKDYLEVHQDGDLSQGANRPGYVKALGLGMLKLQDLGVRARMCSDCHYITDPRLISSGHPSGADFDYVAGMDEIRHWERTKAAPSALRPVFAKALQSRGGVPDVPRARFASSNGGSSGSGSSATSDPRVVTASQGGDTGGTGEEFGEEAGRPTGGRGSGGRPDFTTPPPGSNVWPTPSRKAAEALDLPPFPEIDASTPVEDVLLMIQQRLEELYEAVGRRPVGESP